MLKPDLGGQGRRFRAFSGPGQGFSTLVAFRSRSRPLRRAWGVHLRAAADAIRRGGASTVIAARRMAPTPRATGGRDPPRAGDAARGPCFASRRVWGPQTGKHAGNRALRPHRGVLRTGQTPKTQDGPFPLNTQIWGIDGAVPPQARG